MALSRRPWLASALAGRAGGNGGGAGNGGGNGSGATTAGDGSVAGLAPQAQKAIAALKTLAAAYGDVPLKLGALKGNLGHTITVSGAASLVNVLSAMQASTFPPTLCEKPTDKLGGTPFTLVTTATPWDGPIKRAAVSNFGFGGNNAHLIVENYRGPSRSGPPWPPPCLIPRPRLGGWLKPKKPQRRPGSPGAGQISGEVVTPRAGRGAPQPMVKVG